MLPPFDGATKSLVNSPVVWVSTEVSLLRETRNSQLAVRPSAMRLSAQLPSRLLISLIHPRMKRHSRRTTVTLVSAVASLEVRACLSGIFSYGAVQTAWHSVIAALVFFRLSC